MNLPAIEEPGQELVENDQILQRPAYGTERDALQSIDPGFYIRPPPPPHELNAFVTHDSNLFQTVHFGTTIVDESKYLLVVDGLVDRPFAITLSNLKKLPHTSLTAFHECYGSPLKPPTEALWRIGNVKWTGARLSHLLSLAGFVRTGEMQYVWSDGLDYGEFAGVKADRYQKDLPIAKALQPEVLVAYEMNGKPLKPDRGGPARLVVPGYFVQNERGKGPFTTTFYNEVDPMDPQGMMTRPVWQVQVSSMITTPRPGSILTTTTTQVEGWAWSNDGVAGVDISADGGHSWRSAQVAKRTEYEWQRFHALLRFTPGGHTLIARAMSSSGERQPLVNGRNHVHSITVTVITDD